MFSYVVEIHGHDIFMALIRVYINICWIQATQCLIVTHFQHSYRYQELGSYVSSMSTIKTKPPHFLSSEPRMHMWILLAHFPSLRYPFMAVDRFICWPEAIPIVDMTA